MWGFAGPALNCPSFPPSSSFGCGLGPGLTPGLVGGGTLALAVGTVAGDQDPSLHAALVLLEDLEPVPPRDQDLDQSPDQGQGHVLVQRPGLVLWADPSLPPPRGATLPRGVLVEVTARRETTEFVKFLFLYVNISCD